MARDKLRSDVDVYMTEAHYDDYAENIMEFVKNGGGLIGTSIGDIFACNRMLIYIIFINVVGLPIYNL